MLLFNTTFNNISVISRKSVLLVEETRVHGENHRPNASPCQILCTTGTSCAWQFHTPGQIVFQILTVQCQLKLMIKYIIKNPNKSTNLNFLRQYFVLSNSIKSLSLCTILFYKFTIIPISVDRPFQHSFLFIYFGLVCTCSHLKTWLPWWCYRLSNCSCQRR